MFSKSKVQKINLLTATTRWGVCEESAGETWRSEVVVYALNQRSGLSQL